VVEVETAQEKKRVNTHHGGKDGLGTQLEWMGVAKMVYFLEKIAKLWTKTPQIVHFPYLFQDPISPPSSNLTKLFFPFSF
jgi:hypothetical protein